MKRYAIIPAGGVGKRIGGNIPKQFIQINSKEIIAYTLSVFDKCKLIDEIAVAVSREYFSLMKKIVEENSFTKNIIIAEGGKTRQDSVFSAIASVSPGTEDFICVHDAARPFLSLEILQRALFEAESKGNAVVAIKARDTLAAINSDSEEDTIVANYPEREKIFYIQTPQIFRFDFFSKAMDYFSSSGFQGTDESMLAFNLGEKINLVEGELKNFKITTKEDLDFAAEILK